MEKSSSSDSAQPVSAATADLPIERLTSRDIQTVEDFLRRGNQLSNRAALARRLLLALFERMDLPDPHMDSGEAERLLGEIVQASRNRGSG